MWTQTSRSSTWIQSLAAWWCEQKWSRTGVGLSGGVNRHECERTRGRNCVCGAATHFQLSSGLNILAPVARTPRPSWSWSPLESDATEWLRLHHPAVTSRSKQASASILGTKNSIWNQHSSSHQRIYWFSFPLKVWTRFVMGAKEGIKWRRKRKKTRLSANSHPEDFLLDGNIH